MNLCFSVFIGETSFSAQIFYLIEENERKTGKLCGKSGDFGGNTWNIIGSNKQDERL